MIHVLMADDDKLVRQGFRLMLERVPDLVVTGEARDGQEAVELTAQLQPDVVLMDVKMPRKNGLDATREIHARRGSPKVLMVAMTWDQGRLEQALADGAVGYVLKSDAFTELEPAIRAVLADQIYISQSIARELPGDAAAARG